MFEEIIENTILKKRPEQIDIRTYGNYEGQDIQEGIYNDSNKCYQIKNASGKEYTVRSAKAFTAYINEELKRRNNKIGKFATVHLTLEGGNFIADCNFNKGICNYKRLQSEGYEILNEIKDSEVNHEEFLHILRKLKPYINNFNEVYKTCSKIKLLRNSKVTSQPEFNEGGVKDSSFTCVYKLENGEEDEFKLPVSFFVTIPFAKAGTHNYEYEVELIYSLNNFGGLNITLKVPDWENNEEKAIFDEASDIKADIKDAEEILILSDF